MCGIVRKHVTLKCSYYGCDNIKRPQLTLAAGKHEDGGVYLSLISLILYNSVMSHISFYYICKISKDSRKSPIYSIALCFILNVSETTNNSSWRLWLYTSILNKTAAIRITRDD